MMCSKISNSLKGRVVSEETRLRIASTKIGELNPRWGVVPSEEERAAHPEGGNAQK